MWGFTSEVEVPVVRTVPGMTAGLVSLVVIAVTGCSASSAPGTAATAASQSASTAASAPPAVTSSATAPAVTPSAATASSGGIRNLAVSTAVRSELLAAFAAAKDIPASDVAGSVPNSIYYAYDPATGTYWASASYEPLATDSLTVRVGFQDGGSDGLFKKSGNGPWQVTLGGEPLICADLRFFPQAVLKAWSLPTSATPASACPSATTAKG